MNTQAIAQAPDVAPAASAPVRQRIEFRSGADPAGATSGAWAMACVFMV